MEKFSMTAIFDSFGDVYCAPRHVQRASDEYNAAVASVTDERGNIDMDALC